MDRNQKNILVIVLASLFLATPLMAAKNKCGLMVKEQLMTSVKELDETLNDTEILTEVCSRRPAAENILFEGLLTPSKRQFRIMKKVICRTPRRSRLYRRAQRLLPDLFSEDDRVQYKRCEFLDKAGVTFIPDLAAVDTGGLLKLSGKILNEDVSFGGVSMEPVDAFECTGPLADGLKDWPFGKKNLYLACNRKNTEDDEGSSVNLITSLGSLNFDFPTFNPVKEFNFNGVFFPIQDEPELPEIRNCRVLNEEQRILKCSTLLAWQTCNAEMVSGNVLDCRAQLPNRIFDGIPEVHIHTNQHNSTLSLRGGLTAGVYQGQRDRGWVNGAVLYEYNAATPVRAARPPEVCNLDCPNCPENACERRCVFTDHLLETDVYMGPAWLRRLDSCEAPASGEIELSNLDKHRMYNVCEAENAWGGIADGVLYVRVSKFFWLRDPRTRQWPGGWELIDEGQRFRAIRDIEVPVTVYCNE
jgi:hypothetical protein